MAGLRDAGYVVSNGGRAGGWSLGQHFDRLTVADVYRVISTSRPFAFGPATDNPECPVESAANSFLVGSMATTENFLLAQFSSKKLLDLVQDIPSQQKSK